MLVSNLVDIAATIMDVPAELLRRPAKDVPDVKDDYVRYTIWVTNMMKSNITFLLDHILLSFVVDQFASGLASFAS